MADIVISGTGAPRHRSSTREDVEAARAARRGRHQRPLFLIDIAVPRDIEPAVAQARRRLPLRPRRPEVGGRGQPARAPQGGGGGRGAGGARGARVPGVAEVARRGAAARGAAPARRARSGGRRSRRPARRLGPLTAEQEQALEAATAAIVNKLLHAPDRPAQGAGAGRPPAGADRPHPQAARACDSVNS